MNNKLKVLSLLLAAVLCFSFTACRKKAVEPEFTEATPTDLEEFDELEAEEPDEEDKEEEDKEAKVADETKDAGQYKLVVNFNTQVVTALTRDSSGEYTVPVRNMICSTGLGSNTPTGSYKLAVKYRWQILKGNVYGQWCSQITGNILFHSIPYGSKDPSTLRTALYNQLGTQASAGCIRLRAIDAKWIYDNCASGTVVEMGRFNASYLGSRMGNQKLPSHVNWDPSDPTSGNPFYGKDFTEQTTTTQAPPPTTTEPTTQPPVVPPVEPPVEPEPPTEETTEDSTTSTTNP